MPPPPHGLWHRSWHLTWPARMCCCCCCCDCRVPGVIELLDASEDGANVYLTFTPCEGGDLFRRLQRQTLHEEGLRTLVGGPCTTGLLQPKLLRMAPGGTPLMPGLLAFGAGVALYLQHQHPHCYRPHRCPG
jgi:hypothetical protein